MTGLGKAAGCIIFLLFTAISAFAQRYLTGELSGTYPAGEYTITGNVHILPRTTLKFEPGSILRFENYTGFVVRGELICKGTQLKPITFTSARDIPSARNMPEAFDWNGIKVTSEASGITLENCTIAYSTFGLNIVSNATPVAIKDVTFHHNGQASLSRERKIMAIEESMAISFAWPEMGNGSSTTQITTVEPTPDTQHVDKKKPKKIEVYKPPKPKWIMPVRIASGVAAGAGGIWAIVAEIQRINYSSKTTDPSIPLQERRDYGDKIPGVELQRNIGIGLCCIGCAGFVITFFF